ncbi:MAG: hypothetical protein KBT72_10735 [Zhongshania sp.]|nr:hypothetical protein [Zhongshania sp.]
MDSFYRYSFIAAIGMLFGETYFVIATDKFAPLFLDDYFIAACMLWVTLGLRNHSKSDALLLACWVFVFANLYAMLFTRLEPLNPPDRPWRLLAILVIWSGASSLWGLRRLLRN